MKHLKLLRLIPLMLIFNTSLSNASIVHFQVALTGFQETDGAGNFNLGDPDGFGVADLVIDTDADTIDWNFMVSGVEMITAAHIHFAPVGSNGDIVVGFGALSGSLNGLFDSPLDDIVANPTDYYVNLHNSDFPAGALRGQLGNPLIIVDPPSAVPVPAAIWLFGSGLIGMTGIARRKRLKVS